MGWLSWLFPTEQDRLNKAEKLLSQGEWARARDALGGMESPAALAIRDKALDGLVTLNATRAAEAADARQFERAAEHIALAEQFAQPGHPALAAARRAMREARQKAKEDAENKAPEAVELPPNADPIFSLPPTDPRVRFALALERWPDDLRARALSLGPEFATAALAVDEGAAAHAFDVLGPFVARDPVARFVRARAALLSEEPHAAVEDLQIFASTFGHREMAGEHTAVMLAQGLFFLRRGEEALTVIDAQLAIEPGSVQLGGTRAATLEALGRLAEADEQARALLKKAPREMGLYKLMARCRLKAGKRVEAMTALEAGLTTCCATGTCGSLPFDIEAARMLARLYLEDRMESARASELLERIKAGVKEATWFEGYLEALSLRNAADPSLTERVKALSLGLTGDDPRQGMLREAFGMGA